MDGFWTSVGALIALVSSFFDPFFFWLAPFVGTRANKERRWREMGIMMMTISSETMVQRKSAREGYAYVAFGMLGVWLNIKE
jgi:hypothetical protein